MHVQNFKHILGDLKKHSESLANGLLEFDFVAGDSIALWLDEAIHKVIASPPPAIFFFGQLYILFAL